MSPPILYSKFAARGRSPQTGLRPHLLLPNPREIHHANHVAPQTTPSAQSPIGAHLSLRPPRPERKFHKGLRPDVDSPNQWKTRGKSLRRAARIRLNQQSAKPPTMRSWVRLPPRVAYGLRRVAHGLGLDPPWRLAYGFGLRALRSAPFRSVPFRSVPFRSAPSFFGRSVVSRPLRHFSAAPSCFGRSVVFRPLRHFFGRSVVFRPLRHFSAPLNL